MLTVRESIAKPQTSDYEAQVRALEEQVAFYQSVINALPDPLFVKDEEHRVILVNEAHCQLVGLPAAEILANDNVDPTPRDEQAVFWSQDTLALTSDQPVENEETLTDHQGHRHIISTRKVGHRLPNGKKIVIGTTRDITHRREIEERLHHEQALLRQLLDSIPDFIFYKNMDNRYVGCNRAFELLAGCSEAELVGLSTAAIFPEVAHREFEQQDAIVLYEKRTLRTEQWVSYPDGRIIILDTLLTPFWSPTGEAIGLLGVSRDITERKATEEELRTAKEAAESANRTKSTFLSTITHELRTPMNGVLGLSNLLLETSLTSEQFELISAIHNSGHTLLTLINDILDLSKIEANKLELEVHSFDLRLCIETVLDLVAAQAAAKGLTLAYLVDPVLPTCVDQDETRLRQILANLLSNAVKFTDHGEITVYVKGHELPVESVGEGQSNEQANSLWNIQFTVQDSGIGIPREQITRLFQPFSQADSAISRHYGGTGLGLVISKRLTELMGGKMSVESEVAQGSCFHFSIQAKRSAEQHAPWIESTPMLHGRHILVIEQSVTIQRLLTQLLTTWGIQVTTQRNFALAGLPMNLAQFDATIVETSAKGSQSSHDSAQQAAHHVIHMLRENAPDLPIVLLTQLGDHLALDQQLPTVMAVAKPVHASQLHDALVTVIKGKPAPMRRLPSSYRFDKELAKRRPLHILLAEDNVVNQKVVAGILTNHGYRPDVAADGLEVLDALNRQPYDVILMDVNMPEMDGITVTEIIRNSWPEHRQPYIIALTANALRGDSKRCLDAGMDDYVSKPIQVAEFIQALSRVPATRFEREHEGARKEEPTATFINSMGERMNVLPHAIDLSTLREIAATAGTESKTFFQELIALFLESTPPILERLRAANHRRETKVVGQLAHTLRSPAGQLGADYLVELCAELEVAITTNELTRSAELIDKITVEYERVETALQRALLVNGDLLVAG